MNLCVIPAYNEEKTVVAVIESIQTFMDVVVVDDCSGDSTVLEVKKTGVEIVKNDQNIGYEKSLLKGLQFGIQKKYDYLFTFDADKQFFSSDLSKMQKIANSTRIDFIVGIRPKPARLMEKIACWYFKFKYGINDPLSGLKGYKSSLLETFEFENKIDTTGLGLCKHMVLRSDKKVQIDISIAQRLDKPRFGGSIKANLILFRSLINIL